MLEPLESGLNGRSLEIWPVVPFWSCVCKIYFDQHWSEPCFILVYFIILTIAGEQDRQCSDDDGASVSLGGWGDHTYPQTEEATETTPAEPDPEHDVDVKCHG